MLELRRNCIVVVCITLLVVMCGAAPAPGAYIRPTFPLDLHLLCVRKPMELVEHVVYVRLYNMRGRKIQWSWQASLRPEGVIGGYSGIVQVLEPIESSGSQTYVQWGFQEYGCCWGVNMHWGPGVPLSDILHQSSGPKAVMVSEYQTGRDFTSISVRATEISLSDKLRVLGVVSCKIPSSLTLCVPDVYELPQGEICTIYQSPVDYESRRVRDLSPAIQGLYDSSEEYKGWRNYKALERHLDQVLGQFGTLLAVVSDKGYLADCVPS